MTNHLFKKCIFVVASLACTQIASGFPSNAQSQPDRSCQMLGEPEGLQALNILGGRLSIASFHALTFEDESTRIEISVAQPDFGKVNELVETASGEVFALGDQHSYEILFPEDDSGGINSKLLPVLYDREGCTYPTTGCSPSEARYSIALSAVFVDGYDGSDYKSVIYGLKEAPLLLSEREPISFWSDSKSGQAVILLEQGFALFDRSLSMSLCKI